ncbi:MAG: hypothetical protein J7497_14765, partial [Chitinophagaceae bacterium]|nr:hypothetical protein [Chitinophagaceae bacterium]
MPNEFDLLFDRYISGVLSTEERTAFLDMIASGSFDNGLNAILDKGLLEQLYAAAAEDRTLGDRIFKNVEREINMQPVHMVPRANRTLILMRWAAAAAIIIFFGIGAYLWNFKKEKSSRIVATETRSADPDILPGRQKAILTLADGSTIILDSAVNGKIAEQNSSSIIKQGDRVTYNSDGTENNDVVYNTMSTPNGGQYQLALSDGT